MSCAGPEVEGSILEMDDVEVRLGGTLGLRPEGRGASHQETGGQLLQAARTANANTLR